jgi:effector-binding domain-containing protein
MTAPVVEIVRVGAERIAAVRARVPAGGVAAAFGASLDRVWAFLRRHPGLRDGGHNVFLYHHDAPGELLTVDFGVQVVRAFDPEGDVRCVETPAGEVARIVHRGPYDRMREAHAAAFDAIRRAGRQVGAASWEIYGDHRDDPAALETTIHYLLA